MSEPHSYSKEKRHQYYLNAISKPGYIEKRREYAKRYYQKYRSYLLEGHRKWYDANKEKVKEYSRVRTLKKRVFSSPAERTCAYCGKKYVVLPGSRPSKYCSYECVRNIGRDRARSRYYSHKEEIKAQAANWRKVNKTRHNLLCKLSKLRRENAKSA